MSGDRNAESGRGSSRRQFLLGGTAAGLGAVAAIGVDRAVQQVSTPAPGGLEALNGAQTVPFYSEHQAGIATDAQAHATFVALDLRPEVDADGVRRLLRVLSDDASRLTQGIPALADSEAELSIAPARLTVTFGFGAGLVRRTSASAPAWLRALPPFSIDALTPEFGDGDLVLQIAADDALTVAHATRMLLKDARSFASVRWTQSGFRRAHGSVSPGTTMRNLFGQVDGTSNVVPGTDEFDSVVWAEHGWLSGGTSMVIRRIHMNLDKWDELDRSGRDESVGRRMSDGSPLTGARESDEPDFEAKNGLGFPVIHDLSHIRRARTGDERQRIFRRGYNYDDSPAPRETSNSGLIFVSFQADVDKQFVPIQARLARVDLLNIWTTPVGSAVFAVPPGCDEGGFVGETLF